MQTLDDLRKQLNIRWPGAVASVTCEFTNQVSKITFAEGADESAVWNFVKAFDWDAEAPDTKKFFNDLVLAIGAGLIPADVHAKAKMIMDLQSPDDQVQFLLTFAQDIKYTSEQKDSLNYVIKTANLALPQIPKAL